NKASDPGTTAYKTVVSLALRLSIIVLILYVGLLGLTGFGFATSPTGFIPDQDQGYLLVSVELPPAASVQRTQKSLDDLANIAMATKAVKYALAVSGYSAVFACDSSNWGTIFVILDDFKDRTTPDTQAAEIIQKLNQRYAKEVFSCRAIVFGAPPVPGLGQSSGFQLQVEDEVGLGLQALQ